MQSSIEPKQKTQRHQLQRDQKRTKEDHDQKAKREQKRAF